MDYEKASDFDINKAVAELQPYTTIVGEGKYPSISEDAVHVEQRAFKYGNINEFGVDYCKNPSDAWPIITSNAIDIEFAVDSLGGIGQSHVYVEGDTDLECNFNDNSKALRAAMIVYLMMQESGL